MRLFTGSYGTLGIISQITFRLYPIPEASRTLLVTGNPESLATLAKTIRQSGLTPTAAELLSPSLVRSLEPGARMGLMLRFQSISESIAEQISQVSQLAQQLNCSSKIYTDSAEIELGDSLQKEVISASEIICKIGILPSQSIELLIKLDEFGMGMVNLSSGLGKISIRREGIQEMRSLCQSQQGFLSILAAPKAIKEAIDPWGYQGNALAMMEKIKQKFDPNQIFSPQRFVGNL
jgi:glycolate oxidase FAD binding subunit